MVLLEVRPPIDEHIVARSAPATGPRARDEHELLVEEMLDDISRRLDRPVHHREVECPFDEPLRQHRRRSRDRRDGDVGRLRAQLGHPFE